MNNIKDFNGDSNLRSLRNFWLSTAPMLAGVLLLTLIVVVWERESVVKLRESFRKALGLNPRGRKISRMRPPLTPSPRALHGEVDN